MLDQIEGALPVSLEYGQVSWQFLGGWDVFSDGDFHLDCRIQ